MVVCGRRRTDDRKNQRRCELLSYMLGAVWNRRSIKLQCGWRMRFYDEINTFDFRVSIFEIFGDFSPRNFWVLIFEISGYTPCMHVLYANTIFSTDSSSPNLPHVGDTNPQILCNNIYIHVLYFITRKIKMSFTPFWRPPSELATMCSTFLSNHFCQNRRFEKIFS